MFIEIDSELIKFSRSLFTGHIRFGVEHGNITSLQLNSKIEPSNFISGTDWLKAIKEQFPEENNYFGSIEFNMSFGKIVSFNYFATIQGESLKKRLEDSQCRSVKYVVKKSNT